MLAWSNQEEEGVRDTCIVVCTSRKGPLKKTPAKYSDNVLSALETLEESYSSATSLFRHGFRESCDTKLGKAVLHNQTKR